VNSAGMAPALSNDLICCAKCGSSAASQLTPSDRFVQISDHSLINFQSAVLSLPSHSAVPYLHYAEPHNKVLTCTDLSV
jgi:hypothetical protein